MHESAKIFLNNALFLGQTCPTHLINQLFDQAVVLYQVLWSSICSGTFAATDENVSKRRFELFDYLEIQHMHILNTWFNQFAVFDQLSDACAS